MRKHQKYVGHEAGFFLYRQYPVSDVLGKFVEIRNGKAADGFI